MIRLLALISWGLLASTPASILAAQDVADVPIAQAWEADRSIAFDATSLDIDELIWLARPVVIFADSPNDPRFRRQLELLADRAGDMADRDVIILTDTDPAAQSMLRERLRPRGFALVLIGKDGNVVLRKPNPWTAREISRSIDKMPLRQQEVEDRRAEP